MPFKYYFNPKDSWWQTTILVYKPVKYPKQANRNKKIKSAAPSLSSTLEEFIAYLHTHLDAPRNRPSCPISAAYARALEIHGIGYVNLPIIHKDYCNQYYPSRFQMPKDDSFRPDDLCVGPSYAAFSGAEILCAANLCWLGFAGNS